MHCSVHCLTLYVSCEQTRVRVAYLFFFSPLAHLSSYFFFLADLRSRITRRSCFGREQLPSQKLLFHRVLLCSRHYLHRRTHIWSIVEARRSRRQEPLSRRDAHAWYTFYRILVHYRYLVVQPRTISPLLLRLTRVILSCIIWTPRLGLRTAKVFITFVGILSICNLWILLREIVVYLVL